MYLNNKRIEQDKWTEIKVNDQICFGTPISKNCFRYILEQLPNEDYQLVRVGQQISDIKKKCQEGISSKAETVVANASTDTFEKESITSSTNETGIPAEAANTVALLDTEKVDPVGSSSGIPSNSAAANNTAEGNSNQMMFSMQEEFLCVICQELFINAHVLSCSHSFCETCITDWLKKNNICPICRKKVVGKPVRSLVLDNAINRLVECMPEKDRNERAAVLKDRAPKPEKGEVILITDSPIQRVNAGRPNRVNVIDSSDSDSEANSNSEATSDSEANFYDVPSLSDLESDNSSYNGLPGYNWGGFGHCYRCGEYYSMCCL